MDLRFRAVGLVTVAGLVLVGASRAEAEPALDAAQQEKLRKIQQMFEPGGKTGNAGYGLDKAEEFCGAKIPLEVHPSTVAYDDPNRSAERSEVVNSCHALASALVYTCGTTRSADPVVKEMLRASVKKLVCKSTKDKAEVNTHRQRWSLEGGTLTLTCLPEGCAGAVEDGKAFLEKNVKNAAGLSVGGQLLKQKMLEALTPAKQSLFKMLEERCGLSNLSVSVEDTLAEHYTEHTGHSPTTACDAGLQSLYNLCARGSEYPELNGAAVGAAAKKHLKGISCVYSEEQSIALQPGGILELGVSASAPVAKWKGRNVSIHEFYMNWLSANVGAFATGGASSRSASSGSPAAPPPAKKAPKKH